MPPKPTVVERLVGVFILLPVILVAILVVGLAQQKGWFSHWMTIKAPFLPDTIVPVGTKVTFGGAEIGRVRAITTDDNGNTIAHLHVREYLGRRMRTDSKAFLLRPNIIGDPVVNVSFGAGQRVKDGDTIQMRGAEELQDITPDFLRKLFNHLLRITEKSDALLSQLDQPQSPINRVLTNADKLLTDLTTAEQNLLALMRDQKAFQKTVSEQLAAVLGPMNRTLRDQKAPFPIAHDTDLEMRLNPKLQGQVDQLIAMAEKLDKMLDTTMNSDNSVSLLLRSREFYDRTLDLIGDLKALMSDMREIMANLRKISPDLTQLVVSGRSTLDRGSRLLKQLERNPLLGPPPPERRVAPAADIEQRFNQYKVDEGVGPAVAPSATGRK
jgi:hypothetical protein